jgi:hypothetical protein
MKEVHGMSPLRYKTLLTYLPGMAGVVNSFESPAVQAAVYAVLMEALDCRLQSEGVGRGLSVDHPALSTPSVSAGNAGELTHDLIEGESIHASLSRSDARSSATVL